MKNSVRVNLVLDLVVVQLTLFLSHVRKSKRPEKKISQYTFTSSITKPLLTQYGEMHFGKC